jgi:hypothetical protein
MKPKLNPDFPTTPILIMLLCSALIALAVGISGAQVLYEGLKTGGVYRMTVVFGDSNMVYRSSSPVGYWTMMGIYSIGCVGGTGLGILMPIYNIRAYIKKLARQKREKGNP